MPFSNSVLMRLNAHSETFPPSEMASCRNKGVNVRHILQGAEAYHEGTRRHIYTSWAVSSRHVVSSCQPSKEVYQPTMQTQTLHGGVRLPLTSFVEGRVVILVVAHPPGEIIAMFLLLQVCLGGDVRLHDIRASHLPTRVANVHVRSGLSLRRRGTRWTS